MLRRYGVPGALLAALALSAGGGGEARAALQGEAAAAELIPPAVKTILIFPFENMEPASSSGAGPDWLGEGLAELTAERLWGHGAHVFSRQERLDALERMGLPASASLSRASLLRLAESMDADEVVVGRYQSDGRTLRLWARLLRVNPPALSPEYAESGPLGELTAAHGRLAWRLLCEIAPGAAAEAGPPGTCGGKTESAFLAGLVTVEPQALELYVRGLNATEDEERLQNLRQAARLLPGWEAPAFALAETYFARGDCESALPWLSRVPPARPPGLQAGFQAGVCHLLRNDAARAEATFSAVLSRPAGMPSVAGPLPEAHNNLGIALTRGGRHEEAIRAFRRAAESDPAEPDYPFNLGVVFLRAGRPAEAVEPLRNALALAPRDAEARWLLALALEQSGRPAEAAAERGLIAVAGLALPEKPTAADLDKLQRIRMRLDPASPRPAGASSPGPEARESPAAPTARVPGLPGGALP